jgi:hypothetical protein
MAANKELEKGLLADKDITIKTKYYAHYNGAIVNVYMDAPDRVSGISLYELINGKNITEYKYVGGKCPDNENASFYLIEHVLEDIENYSMNDENNKFVFPSLTCDEIDEIIQATTVKKNEADASDAARLENERVAAEEAAEAGRIGLATEAILLRQVEAAEREAAEREAAEREAAEREAAEREAAEREAAEEAERNRLAAEATRLENERIASEEAERNRLAAEATRLENERIVSEEAERIRVDNERVAATRVAAEEAAIRVAAEEATPQILPPPPSALPPPPPSKEDEETARVKMLIDNYKTNAKTKDYRKGLPNSGNTCYINSMLHMLVDIDEFLEYILFMNETKKKNETNDLLSKIFIKSDEFNDAVKVVDTQNTQNTLTTLLNLVYTIIKDATNKNSFTTLNAAELTAAQFLLNFTTGNNGDVITTVKINNTNKTMTTDQETIYKKYFEYIVIPDENGNNDKKVTPIFDITDIINILSELINLKKKQTLFETKHNIIAPLKQIFEYVINGIKNLEKEKEIHVSLKTAIIYIQKNIGLKQEQQEDASAVYSLLNVVFEEELFEKYGLNVKGTMNNINDDSVIFLSPINLPASNDIANLSAVITDRVSLNHKNNNQKYILFGNSQSTNKFDDITIDAVKFSCVGIVQHQGGATSAGATGGHYIYYSFKTTKLFNDSTVTELIGNEKNNSYVRCVALYEREDNPQSAASGGSKTQKTLTRFRVSRRNPKKTSIHR